MKTYDELSEVSLVVQLVWGKGGGRGKTRFETQEELNQFLQKQIDREG